MIFRLTTALLIAFLTVTPLAAEQSGKGTRTDGRVRDFTYHPDQVYRIEAFTGYAVSVQFGRGERILDTEFGDTGSWLFGVDTQQDAITFKPKLVPPQPTNLRVRTDRRTYNFVIFGRKGGNPRSVGLQYRFIYPEDRGRSTPRAETSIFRAFSGARNRNLGYSAAGDDFLRPEQAFDDGRKTYIRLTHGAVRPAVFAMEADGRERLVNTADLQDGTIVVSGVHPRLVLRDGPYVLCLFNDRLDRLTDSRRKSSRPRSNTSNEDR